VLCFVTQPLPAIMAAACAPVRFVPEMVGEPSRVCADVAVAVADGADCVSGIGSLVDQQVLHGPVGSLATTSFSAESLRTARRHLI
jgi:hypothetical protein